MSDQPQSERVNHYDDIKINDIFNEVPKLGSLNGTINEFRPPLDQCSSIAEKYTEWQDLGYTFIGGYSDGSTLAINLEENNLMVCFNKKPSEAMLDNRVLEQVYKDLLKGMEVNNPLHNYKKLTVGAVHCANSVVNMGGIDMLRSGPAVMRIALNKQSVFWTFSASKQVFDQSTGLMGRVLNVFNTNDPAICIELMRRMKPYGTAASEEDRLNFLRDISSLTLTNGLPVRACVKGMKNYE